MVADFDNINWCKKSEKWLKPWSTSIKWSCLFQHICSKSWQVSFETVLPLVVMLNVLSLSPLPRFKCGNDWKPWHMGTHLRVHSESYPMNTNMTGFKWFSIFFAFLCFVDILSTHRWVSLCQGFYHFTGFLHLKFCIGHISHHQQHECCMNSILTISKELSPWTQDPDHSCSWWEQLCDFFMVLGDKGSILILELR